MAKVNKDHLCDGDKNYTHSDYNTEQAAHNLVYYTIQLLVIDLRAVQRPVRALAPHAQTEKVRLSNNEVEILVVYLRYVLGCPSSCRL